MEIHAPPTVRTTPQPDGKRRGLRTVHDVRTGRDEPAELIALADTVAGMATVKHPFKAGVPAQP